MRSRAHVFLAASVVGTLAFSACVLDWNSLQANVDGTTDAGADSFRAPDVSADVVADAGMEAAVEAGADTACTPVLLVNEVQTQGAFGPSDEFVEIFNMSDCSTSLNGFTLQYSSASGSSANVIWTGQPADKIEANSYAVVGGQQFQGNPIGRMSGDISGVLSKYGGGVGLFAAGAARPTDSVAYAVLSNDGGVNPFLRPSSLPDGGVPMPAVQPGTGQSIARTPNGRNTQSSADDFKLATTPTPGLPN